MLEAFSTAAKCFVTTRRLQDVTAHICSDAHLGCPPPRGTTQKESISMAESDSLDALWKEAFKAYEGSTERKLQHEPILKKLQTTKNLLTELENCHQGFGGWRNQHSKTWTFLSNCMKPVEMLGGLASDAISLTPFAPASTVLGAAFFLIDVR